MLDVGLYRLWSQVACQRYRQNSVIAKLSDRVAAIREGARNFVASIFAQPAYATAA